MNADIILMIERYQSEKDSVHSEMKKFRFPPAHLIKRFFHLEKLILALQQLIHVPEQEKEKKLAKILNNS